MLERIREWLSPSDAPFEPAWEPALARDYAHWNLFDDSGDAERWRWLTAQFVQRNQWEAARGVDLTVEMKVIIAAQATRLLVGLDIDEYFDVSSIIVHRSTVRLTGSHRSHAGTMSDAPQHLAGQATPGGPVVLSWSAVLRGARHPERGENVVYHEFAHRLDMLNGVTNGTPPLGSHSAEEAWSAVFEPAFTRAESGESVLRSYAATNRAEFFAVATEHFFNRPADLAESEPDLFGQLRAFYGHDPLSSVHDMPF